jgi:flavin reductase (DIM6/NTAB) family NADH-FMN oxidoreductase RutF
VHDEPVSSQQFRNLLSQFASGVTVVAARSPGGLVGFTATGFTSVSLAPPLVLVCVNQHGSSHASLVGADLFGVSVLADDQGWIAERFARSHAERFVGVALSAARAPCVEGSLAELECRRHAIHPAGDHTILVGEVIGGCVRQAGLPLVHFARQFGGFRSELAPRVAPEPVQSLRQGESI